MIMNGWKRWTKWKIKNKIHRDNLSQRNSRSHTLNFIFHDKLYKLQAVQSIYWWGTRHRQDIQLHISFRGWHFKYLFLNSLCVPQIIVCDEHLDIMITQQFECHHLCGDASCCGWNHSYQLKYLYVTWNILTLFEHKRGFLKSCCKKAHIVHYKLNLRGGKTCYYSWRSGKCLKGVGWVISII